MLTIENLFKTYEGQPLLKGVTFSVAPGETVCLLGPSGSGKSTLLRLISGLEQPEDGRILWEGADQAGVPVHRRQFGLMFQEYALFPHRSVAENVAFGLRMQRLPAQSVRDQVREALQQVNLAAFADRRVTDLSGGEQQRVALARALAPRPRLLMLDEPLGALDRTLREQLLDELRGLLHRTGIPAIYVTHDQQEAYALADRMLLLHAGRVEQDDTPNDVFHYPATAWAAQFLGFGNLLAGEVCRLDPLTVRTDLGNFVARSRPGSRFGLGQAVSLLLRPGGARSAAAGGQKLAGRVVDCSFRGEGYRIELVCANRAHYQFVVDRPLAAGEEAQLDLADESVYCMAVEG
jgi:ABC-type Fe3+/spermidine/putrescine transport system ATPase subunit